VLQVIVGDARGRPVRVTGLSSWLRRVAPAAARGRVSIALVSDRRMQALNRAYRRKDYATDVLSFPAFARADTRRASIRPAFARGDHRRATARQAPHRPPTADHFLGEIVIARGVARRQAREARHSELTELRVLALHGLLHLLGYDHESDGGEMRRTERRLRRQGGLVEGLIERSGVAAPQ
jgi:probable rRNA maturation factor